MRRRFLFFASLVIILVMSWANIRFFGYGHKNHFSPGINQAVHCMCLGFTCLIGYLNWKGMQKWLSSLWLLAYAVIFIVAGLFFIAYFISGGHINPAITNTVINIRNQFTEPIPFLVFYILHQVRERVAGRETPGET